MRYPSTIKVLDSREVQGYPWVVPASLDPQLRSRIIGAFRDIRDPSLLDLLRAKSYEPVDPSDYDETEREAKLLGLVAK